MLRYNYTQIKLYVDSPCLVIVLRPVNTSEVSSTNSSRPTRIEALISSVADPALLHATDVVSLAISEPGYMNQQKVSDVISN